MILIIGGSSQGKTEFAASRLGADSVAGFTAEAACGNTGSIGDAFDHMVILQFHEYIANVLDQNQDPAVFTRNVVKQRPQLIVMNEVGYGIVPIDKRKRLYREAVGRAGQMLAAEADEVWRVVCGIGTRIK